MTDETKTLINYWLERADKAFQTAQLFSGNAFWDAVADRLYFASYYSARALLLTVDSKSIKPDSRVKTLFNHHFIKTGLVPAEFGVFYKKIYGMREDANLMKMVRFLPNEVEPLIPETENFINTIKKLIDQ